MASLATPDFVTARQAWRLFHGPTKAAARRRELNDKAFKHLFPEGHNESLRPIAEDYAAEPDHEVWNGEYFGFVKSIHPRAARLLSEYGTDYSPLPFDKTAYEAPIQPVIGKCFRNARLAMLSLNNGEKEAEREVMYAEGLVYGPNSRPMLHGWNVIAGSDKAWDWTYYATTQWTRYLGIPFSGKEYEWLIEQVCPPGTSVISLFRHERFPALEPHLLELLGKRTPKNETPAV